jgi:hypothetical protein
MAFVLVSEFPGLAGTAANEGAVDILPVPPIMETQVTASASGVIFGPFQPLTQFVEICAQTTCSVVFGLFSTLTTATVTTGNGRINANERIIRRIPSSPKYGGASTIPQVQPAWGMVVIIAT